MRRIPLISGYLAVALALAWAAGAETAPQLAAFPGAEGFGSHTPGGRGGRVVAVTNLNDAGPGSLRDALETQTGPRIVVFRVSGTIPLTRDITLREPNSYVTVAGQTAPGDGIQLRNRSIAVTGGAHDVVIRHLRLRPGTDGVTEQNGGDIDGILVWGNNGQHTYNVVVDHCSVMWAVDENANAWGEVSNVTFQWCIFAEGATSGHAKGPHSMGMLLGGGSTRTLTASVHHSLFAHNGGRNPLLGPTSPKGKPAALFDFRNNVVYNWSNNNYGQFHVTGNFAPDNLMQVNFVGNHYLRGPSSNPTDDNIIWVQGPARFFIDGNWTPRWPAGTTNGWDVGVRDPSDPRRIPVPESAYRARQPFPTAPVRTTPTDRLHELVLAHAGATRPRRDEVDARVVADVRARTGKVGIGSGYPTLKPAPPPPDADHDGMPDEWERRHGLDPQDPADGPKDRDGDGYTNVEEYLSELAGDPMPE